MAMGKRPAARQGSPLWVTTADLPTNAGHPFFERLNPVLKEAGFDAFVEGLCAVFYAARLGRPLPRAITMQWSRNTLPSIQTTRKSRARPTAGRETLGGALFVLVAVASVAFSCRLLGAFASSMAGRGYVGPSPTCSVLGVQRCQAHKCRNVLGHLPGRLHRSVSKALRDAWNLDSADRAARVLERLAGSLERDHPGAAASIPEGLEETPIRCHLRSGADSTASPQRRHSTPRRVPLRSAGSCLTQPHVPPSTRVPQGPRALRPRRIAAPCLQGKDPAPAPSRLEPSPTLTARGTRLSAA